MSSSPQTGEGHVDPHPSLRDPRGHLRLRNGRTDNGAPAARQSLLHPLPKLFPGSQWPLPLERPRLPFYILFKVAFYFAFWLLPED